MVVFLFCSNFCFPAPIRQMGHATTGCFLFVSRFGCFGGCFFQVDKGSLEKYLPVIFSLLLRRLMSNKTVKYIRFLTIFWSIFIVKYGVVTFNACLEQQEPG